jgi:hypothetical protein
MAREPGAASRTTSETGATGNGTMTTTHDLWKTFTC